MMHEELQSLENRLFYDDDVLVGIDGTWSNNHYLYVSGWVLSKNGPLDKVEIIIEDAVHSIDQWLPRPSLADLCARYNQTINCGFQVLIDRPLRHQLTFNLWDKYGSSHKQATIVGLKPLVPQEFNVEPHIYIDFINEVNEKNLGTLEIGSRVVSPGSSSKRPLFPGAQSYTGFDYYPDSNTDVVGDAHRLSSYFEKNKFDAVFSLSVFEHLAMPWLVAMEIHKVMKPGGITYHSAPAAVPIHERPWDFWRYTEESLRVLFSPAMGFEVIKTGYTTPARIYCDDMHPGFEREPLFTTFRGVQILARKVAEIDYGRFNWDITIEEVVGQESKYPKKL